MFGIKSIVEDGPRILGFSFWFGDVYCKADVVTFVIALGKSFLTLIFLALCTDVCECRKS